MKIPPERLFVLATYEMLLKNRKLIVEKQINCSVYLSAQHVLDNINTGELSEIRKFFSDNGLRIISHGPFVDLNPGSLDPLVRNVAVQRFIQTIEVSKLLGSESVTFHSGFRPKPYKKYYKEWLANSVDSWRKVAEIASHENMNVNVENAFEETPQSLVELVRTLDIENFKLCFDAGHFNAFSDTDSLEAFEVFPKDRIGEIHLSDNDGSDDQHLPLGEGNIDLGGLLEKVEFLQIEPTFTLEPKDIDGAEKDLEYLRNKGFLL